MFILIMILSHQTLHPNKKNRTPQPKTIFDNA